MLIVLPPSETKADGGDGPPLQLDALSFGELTPVRERVARTLARASEHPKRAMVALDLGPTQVGELQRNVDLHRAPTRPAIERYTGVLYDALDVASLTVNERARANERLAVCSALFGLVRAGDRIPAYRLSAGSKLPRIASLAAIWKPRLQRVLASAASDGLVIDLRSGAYRSLAILPGAITVRVLTERVDGTRGVVSHSNKATKGLLARLLVQHVEPCLTLHDVAAVARRAGLTVELQGDYGIDIVLTAA
ncbi:MAG: peroxide stress protein YaaA [Thermoleophilia bacterium]|nr:peroxide stress protein YaaA [Thermoleophilia bacterium]